MTVKSTLLYWSEQGEIACKRHAPHKGSDTWNWGRWRRVTPQDQADAAQEETTLRCEHCEVTWHVVTSQGRVVLGVFGAALLSDAQECARKIEHTTGFPAFLSQKRGQRPYVGETWPPSTTSSSLSGTRQ